MGADILDQIGHPGKRRIGIRVGWDQYSVVIGLDHRIDVAVDRIDGPQGTGPDLFGRNLSALDQRGDAHGIEGGIFEKLHG